MPIKRNNIKSEFDKFTDNIVKKSKRMIVKQLIVILDQSQLYTPLQFGTLRNSAFRTPVKKHGAVLSASVGFTAGYALALHESDDWKPRQVGQRGKKKGGANMRATSKFLTKGVEETKLLRAKIVKDEMKI
ncbi:MAG: hypothetical protein ACPH3C_06185 [Glaciecola sp.]